MRHGDVVGVGGAQAFAVDPFIFVWFKVMSLGVLLKKRGKREGREEGGDGGGSLLLLIDMGGIPPQALRIPPRRTGT